MARRSADRGLVESTQLSILMPLLLVSLLAVVQAGIWLAGRSTAQQAAMTGAEHAAFAVASNAHQVATQVAERGGLSNLDVRVVTVGTTVEVSVAGRVPSVLPGSWSTVQATAHRVKEG